MGELALGVESCQLHQDAIGSKSSRVFDITWKRRSLLENGADQRVQKGLLLETHCWQQVLVVQAWEKQAENSRN